MDQHRFDSLCRALTSPGPRRRLLGLIASLPLLAGLSDLLNAGESLAKDRRRRRKQRHKRRKSHGKRTKGCKPKGKGTICAGTCGEVKNRQTCGKTVDCGPCPCDPACADGQVCQGGVCGVVCGGDFCPAASEICVDEVCTACDVTCAGSAAACGDALQDALANVSLATVHVCPGTYEGGFSIARTVTVIGAGEGADPASNTILDGATTRRVLEITGSVVDLRRLRVARGEAGEESGGGIRSSGFSLEMHDCTSIGNRALVGAGISHISGPLAMTRCTLRDNVSLGTDSQASSGGGLRVAAGATLTDCLIEDNTSEGPGGGIFISFNSSVILAGTTRIAGNTAGQGGGIMVSPFAAVTIGEACRVTGNTASAGNGGGISNFGTVTLQGAADPSPIVVDNCEENCVGGVPRCQPGGTCPGA